MNKLSFGLCLIIHFTTLIVLTNALHTKKYTNHRTDDQDQYANSLQQRQSKIKSNLENLLNDMKKVDMQISNKAPEEQRKQLETALASQRTALYQIESYLSEYDMNKPCRCQYMTDEQKKSLNTKLVNVNASILAIQKQLQACDDCNLIEQLKNQLDVEKKYLQNLQMTINSECCSKNTNVTTVTSVTNGTNAINGTSKVNQTFSNCPPERPYWNETIKSCTVCIDNGFWNATLSKCQSCPNNNVWDQSIKKCRLSCDVNQIFNPKTSKCQRAPCPKQTPFWNQTAKKCSACPPQTPKFNQQLNICQYPSCQNGRKWDIDLLKCILICETGTIYNKTIDQCSIEYSNISTCNIGMTYIEEQLRCVCPKGYQTDQSGENCIACSSSEIYDNESKTCQTQNEYCGLGYFYAKNLTRCFQTCEMGWAFNYMTLTCIQAQNTNGTIYTCPENFIYDPKQHKCISCPTGYVLDLENIRCLKSS